MAEREKFKLFIAAICAQRARWEPFTGGKCGEICTLGIRHFTHLDFRGLPVIDDYTAKCLQESMAHKAAGETEGEGKQ